MAQIAYPYKRQGYERYIFTSVGRNRIVKLVDFSPTKTKNLYHLGFGDLMPDGTLDYTVNSNNGDIVKVLMTIIQIIRDFTAQFPEIMIFFSGSSEERIQMFRRFLVRYYEYFKDEFIITAFILTNVFFEEVEFDPQYYDTYFAFFIKRIT